MKNASVVERNRSQHKGTGVDFVFITDPLDTLQPGHDTSVALMEAAQLGGHRVLVTTIADLAVIDGRATARCRDIRVRPAVLSDGKWIADTDWYNASQPRRIALNDVAAVFMRTDPPVDTNYLRATFILDLVDPTGTLLVNAPAGLRDANEKMFALRLPELGPDTAVSADRDDIINIVEQWGTAVLKPTDGMGGRGILLLRSDDTNLHSILDTATVRGRDHVVVQKYISAANGDRRVIVLNGQPLGALRRVATGTEFRCNMATGAAVFEDEVSDRDREICAVLGPELVSRGLYFAGIDVIGGLLTEVNVTSPTGIREIDALSGTRLAGDIIDWVSAQCASRSAAR
jgi:glutathione synthase